MAMSISTAAYRSVKLGEGFIEITPRIQRGFERSLSAGVSQIGSVMFKALTVPLTAASGVAVKFATDFGANMAKVQALTHASAEDVKGFSDILLKEGPKWGKTPVELSDALYLVSASGFQGAEAMEVLKSSAEASSIGLGHMDMITKVATGVMSSYGKEAFKTADVLDILTASAKESDESADELAQAMLNVIPIAANLGVEFWELAAATGAMTRTLSGPETGTALRQFLVTLQKPSQAARDMLNNVGLSVQGLRDQIRDHGLLSVIETLTERFGDNEEASAALFNNVRALTGFLSLANMEGDELRKIFDNAANSAGSFAEAVEITQNTMGFRFERAMAEIQASLIVFGDILLPAVAAGFEKLRNVFHAFTFLAPEVQTRIVGIVMALIALGPALILVGKAMAFIQFLPVLFKGISTAALAATLGVQGFFLLAPLAAKFIVVAVVIAAIIAALVKVYNESEAFRESLQALGDVMTGEVLPALGELWDAFGEVISAAGSVFGMEWEGTGDALASLLRFYAELYSKYAEAIEWSARRIRNSTEMGGDGFGHWLGREWSAFWRSDLKLGNTWVGDMFGSEPAASGKEWLGVVDGLVASLPDLATAVARVQFAQEEHATAQETLRGEYETTIRVEAQWRQSVKDSIDILDSQNEAVKSARSELRGYHEVMDILTDSIEENIDEVELHNGMLDITTSTGRLVEEQIERVADSIRDNTKANLETKMPLQDVIDLHNERYDALVDEMRQLGLTESQAQEYLDVLGLVPHDVTTLITLQGYEDSHSKLSTLLGLQRAIQRDLGVNASIPMATGGFIRGPGTGTSDSIPAMLSNGEFVVNAAAVQAIGLGNMFSINRGILPAFDPLMLASGGPVFTAPAPKRFSSGSAIPVEFGSAQDRDRSIYLRQDVYLDGKKIDARIANKIEEYDRAMSEEFTAIGG